MVEALGGPDVGADALHNLVKSLDEWYVVFIQKYFQTGFVEVGSKGIQEAPVLR